MSAYDDYLRRLTRHFWDYVESDPDTYSGLLDSDSRNDRRPPVFMADHVDGNILMPPDVSEERRRTITETLPNHERHRYFGSMRSSQALAQSVFGNLIIADKLGLLRDLESDEGLPAFYDGIGDASAQLEFSIKHLREPRPTSVDVWVKGSSRVAVECKLAEAEFGTCSRPRLRTTASNYPHETCDGSYRHQNGRQSRCTLTEIGVRYWDFAPEILAWDNSVDMQPCPLRDTYQLVRNILAACVTEDSKVDTQNAHALVIYDAHNPAYQEGGKAFNQFQKVKRELKDNTVLRSCSWQKLIRHISRDPDADWLCNAVIAKYAFNMTGPRRGHPPFPSSNLGIRTTFPKTTHNGHKW